MIKAVSSSYTVAGTLTAKRVLEAVEASSKGAESDGETGSHPSGGNGPLRPSWILTLDPRAL